MTINLERGQPEGKPVRQQLRVCKHPTCLSGLLRLDLEHPGEALALLPLDRGTSLSSHYRRSGSSFLY